LSKPTATGLSPSVTGGSGSTSCSDGSTHERVQPAT
jgi:hypothetical protein